MQASAKISFQRAPSKRTVDNLIPVKLQVQFGGKQNYYSIREKISNHKWLYISEEELTEGNRKGLWVVKSDKKSKEYHKIVSAAEKIISDLDSFSFGKFEERYFLRGGDWDNFVSAMDEHITELKKDRRYGYASSFESTLRAVMEFHSDTKLEFKGRIKVDERLKKYYTLKELRFADITDTWLKKFERSMVESGRSQSTIGIYTRNLRVLFNKGINEKNVKAAYPFVKHKPKTSTGRKMALEANQISLIANYDTQDPKEQYYRDLFMLSFLSNGMNLSDIARMKYSCIEDDEIVFVREKTKNKHNQIKLRVPISSQIQKIINRWGKRTIGFDSYIFPILKPNWDEKRCYAEIKQVTKLVNKYLRKIALALDIKDNISSYTARHSWATIAKTSGTSIEYIKESLGHSSVAVTENYLKSFEKGTRKKHSEEMESKIYNNA